MTVEELIAALQAMPQDALVAAHYDGACYGWHTAAWLTQGGHVAIGSLTDTVYEDHDRSVGAIASKDNRYIDVWQMLGVPMPNIYDDDE